ncbi:MAG: hypothetical protein ACE5FT_01960 [Candidatus Nanoarchaeia archaeon]
MKYGKLRSADKEVFESVVSMFKAHGLDCALHGTSLWNSAYKDIDLLVIGGTVGDFRKALSEIKKVYDYTLEFEKGNADVGLDLEIIIGEVVLHISYVLIL